MSIILKLKKILFREKRTFLVLVDSVTHPTTIYRTIKMTKEDQIKHKELLHRISRGRIRAFTEEELCTPQMVVDDEDNR